MKILGRFDITMDNAFRVSGSQPVGQFNGDVLQNLQFHGPTLEGQAAPQNPFVPIRVVDSTPIGGESRHSLNNSEPSLSTGPEILCCNPDWRGAPITVCDNCSVGFGTARSSAPLLEWSLDGKWAYVSLRQFPFGSPKTAVIPIKPGTAPPAFTKGFDSEADFARIPGCRLVNEADVPTGMSPNYFVSTRRSAKANLFRIYLLQ